MGGKQGKQDDTSSSLLETGTVIDSYPIKINNEQIANLFESCLHSKKTLTWKDIALEKKITFRKCVEQKIDIEKLHRMQPDIEEWIRHGKVELKDCKDLEMWNPNPFHHFKCCIGDLVIHRETLTARVLINGGVKFNILWERYGLTPDIMKLIKYRAEDWIHIGLTEDYLPQFNDMQWAGVFQNLKREDVAAGIRYFTQQQQQS